MFDFVSRGRATAPIRPWPAASVARPSKYRRTHGFALAGGLLLALLGSQSSFAGEYNLVIDEKTVNYTGRDRPGLAINDSIPGPTLHWKEGEEVTINVTNRLDEPASIHWHGLILPSDMDGVPGLSFNGIPAGETFTYRFTVQQNGTYWYHSHSGTQEQSGVYGSLVIDAQEPEPFRYDREYVVMLSDWTDEDPDRVLAKLKKQPDYYNFNQRTVGDFFRDVRAKGWRAAVGESREWSAMRMNRTDLADVTGRTYTFLVNGQTAQGNWTGMFKPGERVRLRFINAAAMTYFDVRIPGLKMEVVQTDGQNVQPVVVDEFRMAVAETYDVIVEPEADTAYTVFAEAMDRSGYARGTLAPRQGMSGPIPALRKPALLTMKDMGMDHGSMNGGGHGTHGAAGPETRGAPVAEQAAMEHGHDQHTPGHAADAPVAETGYAPAERGPMGDRAPVDAHSAHGDAGNATMDHAGKAHGSMDHGETAGTEGHHTATGHGGMDHGAMDHTASGREAADHAAADNGTAGQHGAVDHSPMDHQDAESAAGHGQMNHHATDHGASDTSTANGHAEGQHAESGKPQAAMWTHGPDHHGPANEMVTQMPTSRLHEAGLGLDDAPHRVLVYGDLRSLQPLADLRPPQREIELHLTGSMERYIWSFNGKKYAEAAPIPLTYNERVRVTLVNDTMMNHPIHLHGMWSELDVGAGAYNPRKHTINVKPGERLSFIVTADALGKWAFHCHLLYHMDAGMFREVVVSDAGKEAEQ